MARSSIFVVFFLLLAGCSVPTTDIPSFSVDDDAEDRSSPVATAEPSVSPWGENPVTVAIHQPANDSRNYAPLVRDALRYWEEESRRYAGYSVRYRLEPNASNPDIVVRFVDNVEACATIEEVAGCAPRITDPAQTDRPVGIQVRSGLSNESTRLVVKHELGHTLGLDHEDEPNEVMAANTPLTTLPQPDATARDLPWEDSNLAVYVDYANTSNDPVVREQVRHALDYYERGADGSVPENVTFSTTNNRSAADIYIEFPAESPCTGDRGSCGYRFGYDMDGDGALEVYNRLRITLTDIGPDETGWHIAYWLGYGFGFDERTDWPGPFRDATPEDRESEWWQRDDSAT